MRTAIYISALVIASELHKINGEDTHWIMGLCYVAWGFAFYHMDKKELK